MTASSLYIVSTPIGHLSDISLRALETLKQVDWIVAEDTRHTQHLLTHFGIQKRILSFHQHNEHQRVEEIITLLTNGQSVALVSDAGTPLISDPGYPLVMAAEAQNIRVIPIPGACAAITALSVSGLPTTEFLFVGFPPPKGEPRKKYIMALAHEPRTVIFYESVHRIVDLLEQLVGIFGAERRACLARELTKQYETIYRGPLEAISAFICNDPMQQKGECVLVVAGNMTEKTADEREHERILKILLSEMSLKQAVQITQQLTGASHRAIYSLALLLNKNERRIETC